MTRRLSDLSRFFGLEKVRPSEQTASVLTPRSMPMVVSRHMAVGCASSMEVSTSTEAKYLPLGVMLTVTVLTVP